MLSASPGRGFLPLPLLPVARGSLCPPSTTHSGWCRPDGSGAPAEAWVPVLSVSRWSDFRGPQLLPEAIRAPFSSFTYQ